jgi:hypothetical protein
MKTIVPVLLLVSMVQVSCASLAQTAEPEVVTVVLTSTPRPITATSPQPTAAATPRPPTPTPTISPLKREMEHLIQALGDDGYLSSTSGTFHALDDFDETWAQLNWYQWWETGYSPESFVVSAKTSWDSASDTADWWNSGCGFVFREQGQDDHFLAYLSMDGWVALSETRNGNYVDLGYKYYGPVETPKGQAEVVLVVDGESVHYFVNGERAYSRSGVPVRSGVLAMTLLSGTNKGYGTRCQMEDLSLWVISE